MVHLEVPEQLDLQERYEATCEFVDRVHRAVRRGNRVTLVFEDTMRIRTSALMYLLAQIHKLRLEHGDHCITGTYPASAHIERLLAESGFFKLLRVQTRERVSRPSAAMRYIKFKSDQRLESSRIAEVREEILRDDFQMPARVRTKIFRAATEAMLNVWHHAYTTKSFINPRAAMHLHGRWWLLASLNVQKNLFTLVFADAGVGIPKTLPRKYPIEIVRQVVSVLPGFRVDDGQMIEAAMVLGRSRTQLDNRGKGLLDLTQIIDIVGGGEMNIYSRQGMVNYTARGTKPRNHVGSVEGTLIEWILPLDKALVALAPDVNDEAQHDD